MTARFHLRVLTSKEPIQLTCRSEIPDSGLQIGWLVRGPAEDIHRTVEVVRWCKERGFNISLGVERYIPLAVLLRFGWERQNETPL